MPAIVYGQEFKNLMLSSDISNYKT